MITKKEAEEIIDRLAREKFQLLFPEGKAKDHHVPVYIGDMLKKIAEPGKHTLIDRRNMIFQLLDFWQECGFNKSLQEILEESGVEENAFKVKMQACINCGNYEQSQPCCTCGTPRPSYKINKLKNQDASNLFSFLKEIL